MICVNCGYLLPSSNIKDCHLCGVKFLHTCLDCGQPNPTFAKFCFNCGSKIAIEEESSIQNFNVLSDKRKNVAVVFADVAGFTALSEKMDPEEVREIINDCFEYITKPIYELEGTIDKYIGDCIMILFGAKYSHRDDPRRAVACGLKMLELIREFSEERLSSKGVTLNLSIGVNYGIVVTGSVGNYFDKDYTVMGDVVNTAQRLQSKAGRGEVYVSESTYLETKDHFHYADPMELTVKNKENPVLCYSPYGVKASENDGLYIVQRDQELSLMHTIFTMSDVIRSITISGEGGIGKTTLINKFLSQIENEVKQIRVDCSSVFQNRMDYVLSSMLHKIYNLTPECNVTIKKNKVLEYIGFLLSDQSASMIEKNYNFMSLIMGLGREKEFQDVLNSMQYIDIEREILSQLTLLLVSLSKKYALVITIDDFQWADNNSKKVLKRLIEALSDVKVLFICSVRNDSEALAFENKELSAEIKLQPIDLSGTHEMVCKRLICTEIDQGFFDIILKYTNGNPLYIIEFINSVKRKNHYIIQDNKAYIKESEVYRLQNSIENIILSNFSDLDERSTKFLQIASVFGKEFKLSWVTKLLNEPELESCIVGLLQLNIIVLTAVTTSSGKVEKTYLFAQDTLREVIYGSILNNSKKVYHKAFVEFIESDYSNELDQYYEMLCVHCENAGLLNKAADYYYKTAVKYKNDFNLTSALEYYEIFINRIKDLNQNMNQYKDNLKIVQAYIDSGYVLTIFSNYEVALQQLNKALEVAEHSEDLYLIKLMIAKICMKKGLYDEALDIINEISPKIRENSKIYGQVLQLKCHIFRILGNSKALSIAEQAEDILTKSRDYESLSETMMQAGILYFIKGETENALYYLDKAYAYAEKVNSLSAMASASGNLGIVYHASGRVSKSMEYFTKSLELSKRISNQQAIISGNINLGILYLDKGLFGKAKSLFEESLLGARQASSVLNECAVLTNLGDVMCEKGDYENAKTYYEQSLEISIKHGLPIEEGVNYVGMANIQLQSEELERVPELLKKAQKLFVEADEVSYVSDTNRYMGVYFLKCNELESALTYSEESIQKAEESESDLRKIKALRLKGLILVGLRRYQEGVEVFAQAIALSIQLESDYEAAQGYYGRYMANKAAGAIQEADKDLASAIDNIDRIDTCQWATTIHSEIAG